MSRVGPSAPTPPSAAVAGGLEIHVCALGVRGQQAAGRCITVKTVKLTLVMAKIFISTKLFSLGTFLLCNKNYKGIYLLFSPFNCSIKEKTGPNIKLKTCLCVSELQVLADCNIQNG